MLLLIILSLGLLSGVSAQSAFPDFSFPQQFDQAQYATYLRPNSPPTVWNPTPEEFQRFQHTAVNDPQTLFNGEAIKAGTPEHQLAEIRERENRRDDSNSFAGIWRRTFENRHIGEYTAGDFSPQAHHYSGSAFPGLENPQIRFFQ